MGPMYLNPDRIAYITEVMNKYAVNGVVDGSNPAYKAEIAKANELFPIPKMEFVDGKVQYTFTEDQIDTYEKNTGGAPKVTNFDKFMNEETRNDDSVPDYIPIAELNNTVLNVVPSTPAPVTPTPVTPTPSTPTPAAATPETVAPSKPFYLTSETGNSLQNMNVEGVQGNIFTNKSSFLYLKDRNTGQTFVYDANEGKSGEMGFQGSAPGPDADLMITSINRKVGDDWKNTGDISKFNFTFGGALDPATSDKWAKAAAHEPGYEKGGGGTFYEVNDTTYFSPSGDVPKGATVTDGDMTDQQYQNNIESVNSTTPDKSFDDMSFSDAFSAARDTLGAGQTFSWKGNSYTTNLAPATTTDTTKYNAFGDVVTEGVNDDNTLQQQSTTAQNIIAAQDDETFDAMGDPSGISGDDPYDEPMPDPLGQDDTPVTGADFIQYNMFGDPLGVTDSGDITPTDEILSGLATGDLQPPEVTEAGFFDFLIPNMADAATLPGEEEELEEIPREKSPGELLVENLLNKFKGATNPGDKYTIGEAIYQNLFGDDNPDTFGEKLGVLINDMGAAAAGGFLSDTVAGGTTGVAKYMDQFMNYLRGGEGIQAEGVSSELGDQTTTFQDFVKPFTQYIDSVGADMYNQMSEDMQQRVSENASLAEGTTWGEVFTGTAKTKSGANMFDDPAALLVKGSEDLYDVIADVVTGLRLGKKGIAFVMGLSAGEGFNSADQEAQAKITEYIAQNPDEFAKIVDQQFNGDKQKAENEMRNGASFIASITAGPAEGIGDALMVGAIKKVNPFASTSLATNPLVNIPAKALTAIGTGGATEAIAEGGKNVALDVGAGIDTPLMEGTAKAFFEGTVGSAPGSGLTATGQAIDQAGTDTGPLGPEDFAPPPVDPVTGLPTLLPEGGPGTFDVAESTLTGDVIDPTVQTGISTLVQPPPEGETLEGEFDDVTVQGEIPQFTPPNVGATATGPQTIQTEYEKAAGLLEDKSALSSPEVLAATDIIKDEIANTGALSSTTAINISNTTGMSLQDVANIAEQEMGLPASLATGQGETITGVTPVKPDVILDPSSLIPPTLDTSADTTGVPVDALLTPDTSFQPVDTVDALLTPDMEKAVFEGTEEDTTIPTVISQALDEQDTETLDAMGETPTPDVETATTTTVVPTQTVTQALTGIGTEGTTGIGSTADVKTAVANTVQTEDAKEIIEETPASGVTTDLLDAVVQEDQPLVEEKETSNIEEVTKTNVPTPETQKVDVEEKVFEGETLAGAPSTEVKDTTTTDVFDNVVDVEFEDITDQQAIDVDTDTEADTVVTTDQLTDDTVTPELITTDVSPDALPLTTTDTVVTTDVAPDTEVTTDQQVVVTTDLPADEEVDISTVGDPEEDVEVEVADSDSEVVNPVDAPFECPDGYNTVKQADGTYICVKKGTKMVGRRRIATNPYLSKRGFAGPSPYGPTIKTVGTTVDTVPATKKAS